MWNKVVVACFTILSQICLEGLNLKTMGVTLVSWHLGRYSNLTHMQHKPKASPARAPGCWSLAKQVILTTRTGENVSWAVP
jgi:hypothetical protein